jgi:hypothetical protein
MAKPYGEEFYKMTAAMGRNFIGLQQMRMAAGARVRRFREEDAGAPLVQMQIDYIKVLTRDEKLLLKQMVELYEDSELWRWCGVVKGLGPMAAATFLSYINPYIADTAGKTKAYMGLIPGAKLQAGKKAHSNPQAKGRMYVVTSNVIRAQDPYYSGLYYIKKDYYLQDDKMGLYLEDPTRCPDYAECHKKLATRAEKDGGRAIKKMPCKAHIDNRAKRWLSGILVSHATELLRIQEGLDVSAFHAHRGYIAIPPH